MPDPAGLQAKVSDPNIRSKWQDSARIQQNRHKEDAIQPKILDVRQILRKVKDPSYANYRAVGSYLRESDQSRIEDFMERDGLFLLLEGLGVMSAAKMEIADITVALECIKCIHQVMNSEIGMDFLVRNKQDDVSQQLASVLCSSNMMLKKQVFELLSAVCVYSSHGFKLVHKCLRKNHEQQHEQHLLHSTITELRKASESGLMEYSSVILAFVNCFLLSAKKDHRHSDVLRDLKHESFNELLPTLSGCSSPPLQLQVKALLDTLDECGEPKILITAAESAVTRTFSLLNSPDLQVVYSEFLGKLANAMEDAEKQSALLKKLEVFFDSDCSSPSPDLLSDKENQVPTSLSATKNGVDNIGPASTLDVQQPLPVKTIPPPPPPAPKMPPPPPLPVPGSLKLEVHNAVPEVKFKPVRWNKIATSAEKLTKSVWRKDTPKKLKRVDSKKLRSLFAENNLRRGSAGPMLSPRADSPPIELIESKRSLKINVWLKQFKDTTEQQHADWISSVNSDRYDSDDLSHLLGILPTPEEVVLFKDIGDKRDVEEFGHAEKFLHCCIQIPDCTLRVEVMKCKKDFQTAADVYHSDFLEIIDYCNTIFGSVNFQMFLQFVLQVGNILNENRNEYGNATAVKLNGLLKLSETASSDPKVSLLHFVIQEILKQDEDILHFCNEFAPLAKASRFETDNLRSEYLAFCRKYKDLKERVEASETDLSNRTEAFFKQADLQLTRLETDFGRMNEKIKQLAEYFLEDPSQNVFENFVKDICTFVNQVNAAQQDIQKRQRSLSTPDAKPGFLSNLKGSRTLPKSFARKVDLSAISGGNSNGLSDDLKDGVLKELLMGIRTGSPLARRQRH